MAGGLDYASDTTARADMGSTIAHFCVPHDCVYAANVSFAMESDEGTAHSSHQVPLTPSIVFCSVSFRS